MAMSDRRPIKQIRHALRIPATLSLLCVPQIHRHHLQKVLLF